MRHGSRKPPALGAALAALWLAPGWVAAQEMDHRHAASDSVDAAMEMAPDGPPELPAESPLIRVEVDEDAGVVELVVGPVSLPAGGMHQRPPVQLATLPVEGWLHGFEWEMRDAEGSVLPDRLLHHVNLIDPDHREVFSPIARRLMAAGRETKRERMPGILGVPLEPDSRVLVSAMFASLDDETFDEAYLHVRLDFTPADDPGLIAPRDVYPFYMDVMGPVGEKEFDLPPGTHGRSWEGRPAVDGRLLAVGGHMHDYADWIRLEDVTEGKVVWETEPRTDEDGRVSAVPTGKLWWRGGVRIHADHMYRISVQYTNPLDGPAPDGAMGALGGVILADRSNWPAFDREDEAYATDLRNTLEKPNEAHDHGAMGDMGGMSAGDEPESSHDHRR